jgi:AraC family transcriptional regulator, melibiose operon regulatory protein
MVSFDPNRPDFTPYGFTCVRWSPSPMRRPDHHSEVELNFLGSGSLTYLLGGRKVQVEAGRLAVFWAAIPHQIVAYGDETEYFVATIPFAWFRQCQLPERLVQPLLLGEVVREPDPARAQSDGELFTQWELDLSQPSEETRDVVMLEMEARLLRLARALPVGPPPKRPTRARAKADASLSKAEQMACLIARQYAEPLSVDEIGRAAGLHPNYAMSLFRKAFGITMVEFLTQHRVSHAQRLLVTTDTKIVDVARSSGFNAISRFNDAFRRACGESPRDYRRRHALVE